MNIKRQSGFTLIELFVTVTILGIMVGLAIPSFMEFIANNRLTNATNDLNAAFQYARSEAVKTGLPTTVAAADCGSGADWGAGSFVWVDLDEDGTQDAIELIRGNPTPSECPSQYSITASNGLTSVAMGANGRSNATETFSLCDLTQAGINGRQLTLALSGHLSRNGDYTGC